ncbi:glycerol-3-phosphate dehydrogenase [Coemansia sp. RSA 1939]|nr:glycerol-3-phosphate dehydrogenase [Coemansia sp. RSA 1939]KAJ2615387.1 glycerol-3-phosphate dehydrogenase [Coemansia sp. RSA 1804]
MQTMSDDVFGKIVDIESEYKDRGYAQGKEAGKNAGAVEGRELGLEHGFDIGKDLGFYQGWVQTWLDAATTQPGLVPDRAQKKLLAIKAVIDSVPATNIEGAHFDDRLKEIRQKFKVASAMLGVNISAELPTNSLGSTAARIIAENVTKLPDFDDTVNIWVYEEIVEGKKLTEIINIQHENVKYLPGHKLPNNVVATPDAAEVVKDATHIVVVIPHQFIEHLLDRIHGSIRPDARAISLIKGIGISSQGMTTMTQIIHRTLAIPVSSLSGANIANEIAEKKYCETTIGCSDPDEAIVWRSLFNTPYFRVNCVSDVIGVEFCGALKNVVAVGAGFIDGLGLGNNTKAAIIRIGFLEMRRLAMHISGAQIQESTFMESCGIADVITTCYGGRNRRLAEEFVKTGKPMSQLEKELLNGQKLQGYLTADEVHSYIDSCGVTDHFPLFTNIYKICYKGKTPNSIFDGLNVDFSNDTRAPSPAL